MDIVGRLTVQQVQKKSVRVCICYSSHESRLWHVPFTVERATLNLTLYDICKIKKVYHYTFLTKVYHTPKGAYRCLILDYNKEVAKFRIVMNKRG